MNSILDSRLDHALALRRQVTPKIHELLAPGLSILDMDYFWFNQFQNGSQYLSIGTREVSKDFYTQTSSQELFFNNPKVLAQKRHVIFWDFSPTNVTNSMFEHGVKSGMSIFRRRKHSVEAWHLGTTKKDNSVYERYLNDADQIYRLISFFNEKAENLIPSNEKEFLTPFMDDFKLELPVPENCTATSMRVLTSKTPLKKITLHHDKLKVKLSLREIQMLHFLAEGFIVKEIAASLKLSNRTIEAYINNIRNKLQLSKKSDLIRVYKSNDVSSWFKESTDPI